MSEPTGLPCLVLAEDGMSAMREHVIWENDRLRATIRQCVDALQDEWESNHAEHCQFQLTHEGQCQWPPPAALAAARTVLKEE
jgi:hypothetical protein